MILCLTNVEWMGLWELTKVWPVVKWAGGCERGAPLTVVEADARRSDDQCYSWVDEDPKMEKRQMMRILKVSQHTGCLTVSKRRRAMSSGSNLDYVSLKCIKYGTAPEVGDGGP